MSILSPNSHILYREIHQKEKEPQLWRSGAGSGWGKRNGVGSGLGLRSGGGGGGGGKRGDLRGWAFWSEVSKPSSSSSSVEMEPILDSQHFDQILEKAKELSQPLLVDWMAAWCRKCIYLKPKLEKLAAEYDSSKMKFYYIDVNKVPQSLVKRGNVSKMPTIQLWKDGEMKAEVIGGHKAWLVIEEVREMIKLYI